MMRLPHHLVRCLRCTRGAALTEFVLIVPMMALMLTGVVEGEKGRGGIARLLLTLAEIDGRAEDARRGAGLESLEFDASL